MNAEQKRSGAERDGTMETPERQSLGRHQGKAQESSEERMTAARPALVQPDGRGCFSLSRKGN